MGADILFCTTGAYCRTRNVLINVIIYKYAVQLLLGETNGSDVSTGGSYPMNDIKRWNWTKILNDICLSETAVKPQPLGTGIGTINPLMRFDWTREIKNNRFDRNRTAGKMFVQRTSVSPRYLCDVNVMTVFRVSVWTPGAVARRECFRPVRLAIGRSVKRVFLPFVETL